MCSLTDVTKYISRVGFGVNCFVLEYLIMVHHRLRYSSYTAVNEFTFPT